MPHKPRWLAAAVVAVKEAGPPLAPPPPVLSGKSSGDGLKLRWEVPQTRGCPVTGFALQCCLAAAFLAAVRHECSEVSLSS